MPGSSARDPVGGHETLVRCESAASGCRGPRRRAAAGGSREARTRGRAASPTTSQPASVSRLIHAGACHQHVLGDYDAHGITARIRSGAVSTSPPAPATRSSIDHERTGPGPGHLHDEVALHRSSGHGDHLGPPTSSPRSMASRTTTYAVCSTPTGQPPARHSPTPPPAPTALSASVASAAASPASSNTAGWIPWASSRSSASAQTVPPASASASSVVLGRRAGRRASRLGGGRTTAPTAAAGPRRAGCARAGGVRRRLWPPRGLAKTGARRAARVPPLANARCPVPTAAPGRMPRCTRSECGDVRVMHGEGQHLVVPQHGRDATTTQRRLERGDRWRRRILPTTAGCTPTRAPDRQSLKPRTRATVPAWAALPSPATS